MRSLAAWSRAERRRTDPRPWVADCYAPKQRGLLYTPEGEWDSVLGTRRAGKTHGNGAWCLDGLFQHPTMPLPYITLTQDHSIGNLYAYLDNANRRWDLGLRWKDNKLYHPRGGYIWLVGCKDNREAEKFRGYKYSRVCIDEGGTFRDPVLRWLIHDVLSAALTDVGAPLRVSGSPGPVPIGLFWEITTGDNPDVAQWPTHHLNVFDNPHHRWFGRPDLAKEFRETKLRIGEDHPTWVREYLGRWCLDTTALIYYCDPSVNAWDGALPEHGIRRTTLGVDLGYDDETAFVVVTSIYDHPQLYVRHAHGKSSMLPGDIAQEIQRLSGLYGVQEVYMDSGGLGKTILNQLNTDYGLGIAPAEKTDKHGAIVRTQDMLRQGYVLVDAEEAKPLIDEWNVLVWDEKRKGHRERMPDHNSDAYLYASRPHWRQVAPPAPPEDTLEARQARELERMRARARRR